MLLISLLLYRSENDFWNTHKRIIQDKILQKNTNNRLNKNSIGYLYRCLPVESSIKSKR